MLVVVERGISVEAAREKFCPYSMASPAGPRYCMGDECLGWGRCARYFTAQ